MGDRFNRKFYLVNIKFMKCFKHFELKNINKINIGMLLIRVTNYTAYRQILLNGNKSHKIN